MQQACSLTEKHCVPCEGGIPPLTQEQYEPLLKEIPEWNVVENTKLVRDIKKVNFKQVIELVNNIADIAESEGHHPDLYIHGWNKLQITLTTHAIKGLSENDFILAAKINELITKP